MENIVCKFGGSSVATSRNIEQIAYILTQDTKRRCVVVSAPGKADNADTKVTDLLIAIVKKKFANENADSQIESVKERYKSIYLPLKLTEEDINTTLDDLTDIFKTDSTNEEKYRDLIVSRGEDYNAKLFAKYLNIKGIKAKYISPKDAGLLVTSEFGNAQTLPETSKNLSELKKEIENNVIVFPGFFGVTQNQEVATFSRGGSDLTGAILADALDAFEYENFTDVDGIFSTNPSFVDSPKQIPALTYKEMRELSYIGFNVFHEEAVRPVINKKIPIRLRNTKNLKNTGTLIVAERLPTERDVIGIASSGRFCSITLQKYLMNREKGFGRKLLYIFEEKGLSYEHCPSGVDNISVILDQTQLDSETVNSIIRTIEDRLKPDEIKTEFGIALVAVVGEGLTHKLGVLSQATDAMSKSGVNIKMVNQGSSEISMIFGVKSEDEKTAVGALYNKFFD